MPHTTDEEAYYIEEYWFRNTDAHAREDNFGEKYYVNRIYKQIILTLRDVPKDGYILVIGTNRCISFDILCDAFGRERCLGFDLFNPTNHPRVIQKNCLYLDHHDDIPIALCHNDVGSFPLTPKLKLHCQIWAARNVVSGGYLLGRNNRNRARYPLEEIMTALGFDNQQFSALGPELTSGLGPAEIEGHMLSRKH